jgi:hypothetical protein
MALSSSNTLEQIEAAYIDNASYAETGDASKCRAFITACRILLLKTPKQSGTRDGNVMLSPDLIQKEKEAAEAWLASNSSPTAADGQSVGTVVRASFRNCRD